MNDHRDRPVDLVVYGATGYTGALIAEAAARRARETGGAFTFALAGRSADKLETVASDVGAGDAPRFVADAADDAALADLARSARTVVTAVGPYQLYGEPLLKACIAAGTDYLDLCGEPHWMRAMIDAHAARAEEAGARIVFSCGFDSIPSDLGVAYLQDAARARTGAPAKAVRAYLRRIVGDFAGGTAASAQATVAAAFKDPTVLALLQDPFALTPGFAGPRQPAADAPRHDDDLGVWLAPFIMAPINSKNVHRTNMLRGFPYGEDFTYAEMVMAGAGEAGEAAAKAIAGDKRLFSEDAPKPGEGPTKAEREAGSYEFFFVGDTLDGGRITASVAGDMDPGYGSTSKIIAETALLLSETPRAGEEGPSGGVWTPTALLGDALRRRLESHAGLAFHLDAE